MNTRFPGVGYALLALWLAGTAVHATSDKPAWVEKRPLPADYYIGIGVAEKRDDNRDYIQTAKNNALNDLASEIAVNISGEMVSITAEKLGVLEEEVRSEIHASTRAELEGYELVDTWENNREYWVYYRLPKADYHARRATRLENAKRLGLDLFAKGESSRKGGDITRALAFYLQALAAIQSFVTEPLEVTYQGETILLFNETYSALQSVLNGIVLTSEPKSLSAKIGQPLPTPLKVRAHFPSGGKQTPVGHLPLTFRFTRGGGELVETAQTDASGTAACRVAKVTATDRLQTITARVQLAALLGQEADGQRLDKLLQNLPRPKTDVVLNVSGLTAFIRADERNLGQATDVPYIEPVLKKRLSEQGFTFVENPARADVVFEIQADTRAGSQMYGMYSAYADVTIAAQGDGQEIYKNALQNVKGVHLDRSKAGLKALEDAATKLTRELLPDLIRHIQK